MLPSPRRALWGWLIALPALAFLAAFLVWPLWKVIQVGGVNLSIWRDPYFLERLGWTLSQAGLTVLFGALISWPLAYLLSRHALRSKVGLLRLLLLPFVTPTLVAVLGLTALWGPRGWLTALSGLDLSDTPALLILGNLFFNVPIMLRLAYGGFARVPPQLIGAARTLGASHLRAALTVALPLSAPGLAAGAILVFLYSALSFGLPLTLGGEQYATLEVEIYTLTAYELKLPEASALILGQLVVTLAATLLYTRLTGGAVVSAARSLPSAGRGGAGPLRTAAADLADLLLAARGGGAQKRAGNGGSHPGVLARGLLAGQRPAAPLAARQYPQVRGPDPAGSRHAGGLARAGHLPEPLAFSRRLIAPAADALAGQRRRGLLAELPRLGRATRPA